MNEVIVYFSGTMPSWFYEVLGNRNAPAFKGLLLPVLLLVICAALGKSLLKFVGGIFYVKVRGLLTQDIQESYVQPTTFYNILLIQDSVDNPDQRITQDIDNFAASLRDLCEDLILSPVVIAYYTYECWKVSGYLAPLIIYGYFIVGSIVGWLLLAPIVQVVYTKESLEGNFRFLHVRLRQYAESIAFSRGEKEEKARLDRSLQVLLTSQRNIVNKELTLQVATEFIAYFGSILSYLIIAIPIFWGKYDDKDGGELAAIVSKNAFISLYLIFRFTLILQKASQISDLAGYTARIGQLIEALESEPVNNDPADQMDENVQSGTDCCICFDNTSFTTPSGKTVLSGLNMEIARGNNVMIVGRNGAGKTSLLRVLAGLWNTSRGTISTPGLRPGKDMIFLPQTPYLVYGSLRDQLCYPGIMSTDDVSDDDVRELLQMVHLPHLERLVESFDTAYGPEWSKMVSPGEQQRLVFARILFWKPVFAVLDEATDSLDLACEAALFEHCRNLGVTLVTVSHNTSLIKFHDRVLVLDGKGGCVVEDVDPANVAEAQQKVESLLIPGN